MPVKTLLGLIPVLWLGGLAIYLYQVNNAMGGMAAQQLMPTIIGLGAISVLLTVPIILKLVRAANASPAKGPKAAGGGDDAPESDFDADAVIARYLEKKAAGETSFEVPETAAPRPVFGRKPT